VLLGPPASAPRRAAPLPLTPFPHPAAAHRASLSSGPACQPLAPELGTPRHPPLSRGNGATCARRPGANAGSPSCPPPRPRTPLSSPFPLSTQRPPRTPCPFPLCPTHLSAFKSHRPPTSLRFLSVFLPHPRHVPLPLSSPPSMSASSSGPHRLATGSLSQCRR
jgi:hypothetical protein